MKGIWQFFIEPVETEETSDFFSFEKLGAGLQTVYDETSNKISSQFPKNLQKGRPNLTMTPQEDMHSSVLTIFNHDASKPLPDSTEVLLCTKDTVAEDVEPLCRRAFSDDMHLSVANNRKYDPTNMRIILSHNAGMGKSLQGEQVSERLGFKLEKSQLHNKNVDITSSIKRWKGNKIKDGKVVYGIDVTQAVEISERDDLIFSLAILTGVQNFKGGVWNVNDNNVYLVDVTSAKNSLSFSFRM